mgnify:CR=1 FL=1
MNPRIAIALLLTGALALGAIAFAVTGAREDGPVAAPNTFEGGTMPDGFRAPDFELRDQDGSAVANLRSWRAPIAASKRCWNTLALSNQAILAASVT